MANEITLSGMLAYVDSEGTNTGLQVRDLLATVASKKVISHKQSIATSETAMDIGSLSSLGWCLVINRGPTNFVELRVATAGTKFAKLLVNEFALFRFGSGISAPYAIADTAACQLEYLICST